MKVVIDFWQAVAFYVKKKYIKVLDIGPCMDGVYYTTRYYHLGKDN